MTIGGHIFESLLDDVCTAVAAASALANIHMFCSIQFTWMVGGGYPPQAPTGNKSGSAGCKIHFLPHLDIFANKMG